MNSDVFLTILNQVRQDILDTYSAQDLKSFSDTKFEEVFAKTLEMQTMSEFSVDYQKGSIAFPDIGCTPFGVEIKTTQSNKWLCFGNSIMEGTRRSGVDTIFIAFLKKGGTPDIRIGAYADCISDIKVTHSPRYQVDMDIEGGQTIFRKLNISYDEFKDDVDKIQKLRKYYQEKGVESWWLDEKTGEVTTDMELISFGSLDRVTKDKYLVEIFALFPEMLNKQYGSAATYLISRYGVYDKSFRDKISAGGQKTLIINGQEERISMSVAHLISLLRQIVDFISNNTELMSHQWGEVNIDFVAYWFSRSEFYLDQSDIKKPSLALKELLTTTFQIE